MYHFTLNVSLGGSLVFFLKKTMIFRKLFDVTFIIINCKRILVLLCEMYVIGTFQTCEICKAFKQDMENITS